MMSALAFLSLAGVAGVAAGTRFSLPEAALLPLAVLLPAAVMVAVGAFRRRYRPILFLGLALLLFFAGALRSGGVQGTEPGLAPYAGADGPVSL
ncbi:MAG: hypothetical protein AAB270_09695, partial [Chloroflexota bacterium]